MDDKLFEKLKKRYPILYLHLEDIQTGDGWFDIIDDLSMKLEEISVANTPDEEPLRALQVKEKFGGMRFYLSFDTHEASDLIDEAEARSEYTCEVCGKGAPDGPNGINGWIRTLCVECRAEHAK